jgi:hypothetical protein
LAEKRNIDLPSFYFASDVAFNQHASPYQSGAWQGTEQQLQQKAFPFLYPPPNLLLFLSFSWFSYECVKTAALLALVHMLRGWISLYVAIPVGIAVGMIAWPLGFLFRLEGGGIMTLLVPIKFYGTVVLWLYFLSRLWQTKPAERALKTVRG